MTAGVEALIRDYRAARYEAGKLYREITDGDFTPAGRKAAVAHPKYAEYSAARERRDNAALTIEADRERYSPALALAGVKAEDLDADIKSARDGVRIAKRDHMRDAEGDAESPVTGAIAPDGDGPGVDQPTPVGRGGPIAPATTAIGRAPARHDASLSQALGYLLGIPAAVVVGVAKGFSERLASWMAARNIPQAPAGGRWTPEGAESAVVEAVLASKMVIKKAHQLLESSPAFGALYADIEAAARPEGRMVGDIIKEMKPGGRQEGLWNRFNGIMEDESFSILHGELADSMLRHKAAWTRATVAAQAVGGNAEDLWRRLDESTAAIRTATQGIPVDEGRSFADRAREMMENMKDLFCRLFRIVPSVDGASTNATMRR